MHIRRTLRPFALVLSGALILLINNHKNLTPPSKKVVSEEGSKIVISPAIPERSPVCNTANCNTEISASTAKPLKVTKLDSFSKNQIAYAGKEAVPNKPAQKTMQPKELHSRLQIGGNYTRAHLKPDGSNSFSGNLGGAQAMYEYRPRNCFYGAASVSWREGTLHGSSAKRSLLYIDAQERLGYTFGFEQQKWLLTLFSGVGYRYLNQKLTQSGSPSLRFRYNEFYVPVGMIMDREVNRWFTFGLGATWMPQVFPTVSISPLKGAYWNLKKTLTNFYVQAPLDFTLTKNKRFHLILNPFYEHWEDGHSTAKTSGGIPLGLPSNKYNFWGADLNFAFCF